MEPILSIKDLSVAFDGTSVLKNLSFELGRGENLAVIGPNGSGKTVLVRVLLGLAPHTGKITWTPNLRLGYVPQKIDADRHLPLTARNLLEAKADLQRIPRTEIAKTVAAVGLTEENLKTPVGHLSGGQFQRALIAFALLGKPDVIIFDEPTASVDLPREEQIYELLHRLQDEYGMTSIVVSHDLSFVYRYASKVLCLNVQNVCFGTPEEALTPEVLKKLYGGEPKFYHHIHNHAGH